MEWATVEGWSDFYVAQVGASAALAGLLFVGISISLDDILKFKHLPMRAAGSLTLLAIVLLASMLMLVPDQSIRDAGQNALAIGIVGTILTVWMGSVSLRNMPVAFRKHGYIIIGLKLVAALLFTLSGLVMTITNDRGDGLMVTGCVVAYVVVLTDTWVLLVEVHR